MKFANKVVIAVDLNDKMTESLKKIKNLDFLSSSELHFVHVFKTARYSGVIFDLPLVFPMDCDKNAIRESVLTLLNNAAKECLPQGFKGKISSQCLFNDSPKINFSEYAKEVNADLIIIPTRKKHGFFESSFAEYVNKHTEQELLLLKI